MGFSTKILGLNIGNFWEGRDWSWDSVPRFWDWILEIFGRAVTSHVIQSRDFGTGYWKIF